MDRSSDNQVSGADAAQLYDTYGFPVELTQEIADQGGLSVDMDGFEAEMEERRQKARSAGTAFAGDSDERRVYESLGIECVTVEIDELGKAAGAIGCLTGIIEREMI